MFSPKIKVHARGLRLDDSVTYTSALDMQCATVTVLADFLAIRRRPGVNAATTAGTVYSGCRECRVWR
jgi:hypothetical protein